MPDRGRDDWMEKRGGSPSGFVLRVDAASVAVFADLSENLTVGGLFIDNGPGFTAAEAAALVVGDQIPISLSFPSLMDPLEIVATVAWLRVGRGDKRGGVGVRVESDVDRKRLDDLLNSGGMETRSSDTTTVPPEGYRVLIVEDNPHIIEMYSYVLKKLATGALGGKVPLEVQFAPDGHHALKQLKESRFHLVMTDLYMPVMDGFALVERIRQEEALKNLPVIAISAGGKEAQERALDLGVDIYLRKPVKFVEVLETVKQLLRIK